MGEKGRGKRLTDSERMEIIARLEDATAPLSRAECARIYGVSPAAISKLMKNSQSVKKRYSDAGSEAGVTRDKRQRGGFVKNMGFEDDLFQWICSIRARKVPLLVAHVQQKAKLLAAKHNMSDSFKASNGWYYRFCARYGLAPANLHNAGGTGALDAGASTTGVAHPSTNVNGSGAGKPSSSGSTSAENNAGADSDRVVEPPFDQRNDEEPLKLEPEITRKMQELYDDVASFGPEYVYTLSEARLFYQLVPNQLLEYPPQRDHSSSTSEDRVVVVVCANASGTHKIPILVVGKHPWPSYLPSYHQHTRGRNSSISREEEPVQYFSQREVWCDRHTFQYWCDHVFLPAIQLRTSRPVLLLVENPGGHLTSFQRVNVATRFFPTSNNPVIATQCQPMHHGVIRELKRKYKIALFQEMVSFLETTDDERYTLIQRAMEKPLGAAGMAFGKPPHLLDAMVLLKEAWGSITRGQLQSSWVKANLLATDFVRTPSGASQEINDDVLLQELLCMVRNISVVDDPIRLTHELRQWLYADEDTSEKMQQELLHDVQRLLQEEQDDDEVSTANRESNTSNAIASVTATAPLTSNDSATSVSFMQALTQQTTTNVLNAYELNPHMLMRLQQDPTSAMAPSLHDQLKIVSVVLHTLANAEEALDHPIVREYFGDDVASRSMEKVSQTLRTLRRIHRGKSSSLSAPAHEYIYGTGENSGSGADSSTGMS